MINSFAVPRVGERRATRSCEKSEKNVYRPGIGGVVGGGGLLATTGANLTWWIVFGVVSLVLGVVLVRSARRRARTAD
jgi:hypothetical protein